MNRFFCFLFLISCQNFYGQNSEIYKQANLLEKKIETTTGKKQLKWLDSLTKLVWERKGFDFDSLAQVTIQEAIQLDTIDVAVTLVTNRIYYFIKANKLDESKKIFDEFYTHYIVAVTSSQQKAYFYKSGGVLYSRLKLYDQALYLYNEALKEALQTDNHQNIGEIYTAIGKVHLELGKLANSKDNLQKAIPHFKKANNTESLIDVKNTLVQLFSTHGFYEEAETHRQEALALAREINHKRYTSQLYFNKSIEFSDREMPQKSIELLKQALDQIKTTTYAPYYTPIYLSALVIAYAKTNDVTNAQKYFDLLELVKGKNAPGEPLAYYEKAKMNLTFAKKQYNLALRYGQEFYVNEINSENLENIKEAEHFLAKTYEATKDFKNANKHYSNYRSISDSIAKLKKERALAYYESLYEKEKQEIKIITQEAEIKLLHEQQKNQKQRLRFGVIGLLCLFLLFVVLRSRAFAKRKQRMQQQFSQEIVYAQEQERKQIASELHDNIGQDLLLIKNSLKLQADKTASLVDKTIEDVRAISRNLHPAELEKFGVTKAITNLVTTVNELTEIYFTEEIDNIDDSFSAEKGIQLYRIIQECINNILKHSKATAAKISIINNPDTVLIAIQDNGEGLKSEIDFYKPQSIGIKLLTERVKYLKGKIVFDTQVQKGTKIVISLSK